MNLDPTGYSAQFAWADRWTRALAPGLGRAQGWPSPIYATAFADQADVVALYGAIGVDFKLRANGMARLTTPILF